MPLLEKATQSEDSEVKLLAAEALAKLRLRAKITPRVLQEHPEILDHAVSVNDEVRVKLLEEMAGVSLGRFTDEGMKEWMQSHFDRKYLFVDRRNFATLLEATTQKRPILR